MTTFIGTHRHSIDEKGRIAIPAPVRRAAGKKARTFVLTQGFEGCIALYSEEDWAKIDERMQSGAFGRRKARSLQRAIYFNAARVTVDAQGRVTIPPALIDRAGLGKEAVLLGQGGKLEIWNPTRLDAFLAEVQPGFEDLAEEVMG